MQRAHSRECGEMAADSGCIVRYRMIRAVGLDAEPNFAMPVREGTRMEAPAIPAPERKTGGMLPPVIDR
ncbi:hypothetical protein [Burkholderia sp. 22313]|uniref:hypothetical protein n=1 Tax=Burkholderia sp. 22313 TaxID=3453908 RepID=UPI003F85422E